jgi:hypothetical protein
MVTGRIFSPQALHRGLIIEHIVNRQVGEIVGRTKATCLVRLTSARPPVQIPVERLLDDWRIA